MVLVERPAGDEYTLEPERRLERKRTVPLRRLEFQRPTDCKSHAPRPVVG